jgi:thiol-disulfide isomerase/thioredoxin
VSKDWRAVLTSPGGELPFILHFTKQAEALSASVVNGEESVPISGVECDGSRVVLRFTWYDSEITAELEESGERMQGTWRRTSPSGEDRLAFEAEAMQGKTLRFSAISQNSAATPQDSETAGSHRAESSITSVGGHWAVLFEDEDGQEEARGEFTQGDDGSVHGTFLTPTGDYRFLAGSFELGVLRLSTFDGAHAFLFEARSQEDGSLVGDFWSRASYHATWTAHPIKETEEVLPDPWTMVRLTNEEGLFRFAFPDMDGNLVTNEDARFAGKVVQVNIFGTWCPNCNDEAPLLAEWHRRYRDQGLEIVGLAYEFTGDPERDRTMLQRFATRYGIEYPLLLAGTSDKQEAAATLPDLTAVISYPTSIFIGRDGKVRRIYTGFSGPGTGHHFEELEAELENLIVGLLAEPPNPGDDSTS